MKFEANDIIYTDEDIHVQDGYLAFKAFTAYTVYETNELGSEDLEPILIGDNGMVHPLKKVAHMFSYMH